MAGIGIRTALNPTPELPRCKVISCFLKLKLWQGEGSMDKEGKWPSLKQRGPFRRLSCHLWGRRREGFSLVWAGFLRFQVFNVSEEIQKHWAFVLFCCHGLIKEFFSKGLNFSTFLQPESAPLLGKWMRWSLRSPLIRLCYYMKYCKTHIHLWVNQLLTFIVFSR